MRAGGKWATASPIFSTKKGQTTATVVLKLFCPTVGAVAYIGQVNMMGGVGLPA